uniref:HNH nuclease domain-containing protein n=1 Tax=Timspurckia oligopyrenoides TaxID=708627 RepID=A0A7S1ERX3_9RHOD|mmetsp:Transcript_3224/g.5665  ORF Transcript_3224/g.5665 Transcript_3224/m.5665 type:complete len:218 (+) Transcript_3224:23-676(+)
MMDVWVAKVPGAGRMLRPKRQNNGTSSDYDSDDESFSSLQERRKGRSKLRRELNSFSPLVKDLCWKKAEVFDGRDPDRWRIDNGGNIVCRAFRGCQGPLCWEYDHIWPISKGGGKQLSNCQILQSRSNRRKGSDALAKENGKILAAFSDKSWHALDDQMLDAIELAAYGDIQRPNGSKTTRISRKGREHYELILAQLRKRQNELSRRRNSPFSCPIM